ncbi:MAG: methylenetetrahydrofolate reductase [NAD(P)H] [Ilumatobacter sp.]|uniref:methylenetetrahydrofolate reductase [NAD(P)H] n=1 Tax=Ilumatobacter sp. TaxID=1967498 RepID=UPI00260F25B2|nr:methylenetetrahydrofolate reductase [NAD(P)H] [Ilumatobacter sp.]MDJ0767969.1 methylenetetrahydrofolate reductase [NAD(P)H] [Ilumatobacter sp.]
MELNVSFEVFPPKTDAGLRTLADTSARLAVARPDFVSVTYGAGGSQRDRSFAAIEAVASSGDHTIAGHLTCVGQSRADVDDVIAHYEGLGVRHVVALRGDPPTGIDAPYHPHPDGYTSTAELVAAIKHRAGFEVSVSAYPERHPQSPSDDHDLDILAEKVAAGADRAMTQMFFDNGCFLRLRDRVAARGIDVPLVPGIFPIHSYPTVARFARRCGATMPLSIAKRFCGLDDDPTSTHEVAADLAAEQIADLAARGVRDVHLYTLNKADLALAVCERLGLLTPHIA